MKSLVSRIERRRPVQKKTTAASAVAIESGRLDLNQQPPFRSGTLGQIGQRLSAAALLSRHPTETDEGKHGHAIGRARDS